MQAKGGRNKQTDKEDIRGSEKSDGEKARMQTDHAEWKEVVYIVFLFF